MNKKKKKDDDEIVQRMAAELGTEGSMFLLLLVYADLMHGGWFALPLPCPPTIPMNDFAQHRAVTLLWRRGIVVVRSKAGHSHYAVDQKAMGRMFDWVLRGEKSCGQSGPV